MENPEHPPNNVNREIVFHKSEAPPSTFHLPYVDRLGSESFDDDEFRSLQEYWLIVWARRRTVLLLTLLGGLTGIVLGLCQSPSYQGSTSLEIQGSQQSFVDIRSTPSIDPLADMQTQAKLLTSQSLLQRALAKLTSAQESGSFHNPAPLSGWRKLLGLSPPTAFSLREEALAMAAGSIIVKTQRESRIVEISCSSTDPQLAADFLNTLANEYIQQSLDERWNIYQRTGEWLTRAQEDLRTKLEKSEERLHEFARTSELVFTSEKDNVAEQKLKQLQEELSRAEAERITKQAQFGIVASHSPDSLPEGFDGGPLRQYQSQLVELRRQLAELSSSFTPAHYKVKRVQAQIAELESTLATERTNIISRKRTEYQSALAREKLLANDYANQYKLLSEQAGKLIQYNMLKREVDTNRQLHEATLQKGKEASIASALRASNAHVVDPAEPPSSPYKPNWAVNSALGSIGGLFLGVAFVIVPMRLNRNIRLPGDTPVYLNVRELGVIPSAKADPEVRALNKRRRPLSVNGRINGKMPVNTGEVINLEGKRENQSSNGGPCECVELVTWTRKPSLMAESFRVTLASILFSGQNGSRPKVIVLTSPNPREGKSTVISNLGIALAEISQRVLLVDADMRSPRLNTIFDCANTWGLSSLLRERTSIEDYPGESLARKTEIPGLYILPSGPGTVSVAGLLHSVRMSELLRRLRREFDTLLIDTAPTLRIPDARILARVSDAVILVIRAGRTTRQSAMAAAQCFEADGTPVLGTVLNDWDPRIAGYGYYTSDYFHYGRKGVGP